jgi:hypothetical protein
LAERRHKHLYLASVHHEGLRNYLDYVKDQKLAVVGANGGAKKSRQVEQATAADAAAPGGGTVRPIGNQIERLHDEIVKAFAYSELDQLVRYELSERLDAITSRRSMSEVVFELLDWSERHGRTEELVRAVQGARPRHQGIQSVTKSLLSNA